MIFKHEYIVCGEATIIDVTLGVCITRIPDSSGGPDSFSVAQVNPNMTILPYPELRAWLGFRD